MSELRTYVRRLPFYVKARPLAEGEIVYDSNGQVIRFQSGDMLIELETDRYKMDRTLFDQLYMESEPSADRSHQDVPQIEPSDLGER